ncbi:MAG TPA: transposase [Thermodesulfovibrio thiophilus]|nr:transposase [Thermodesulfovibrio thiophilus]
MKWKQQLLKELPSIFSEDRAKEERGKEDLEAELYRQIGRWYNTEHLHSSIGYVTPNEMRSGKAYEIFNKRNEGMEVAKMQHPERWRSQKSKVWKAAERVVLNSDKIIRK